MMKAEDQRMKERLPVQTVEQMHRLLGGDARVEDMALRFIADRYGAQSLIYLPAKVAEQVLLRPMDFIRATKQHWWEMKKAE